MIRRLTAALALTVLVAVSAWPEPASANRRGRSGATAWPTRGAYFKSIQNRRNLHPTLQRGEILRDQRGMPVALSGANSSAYRFRFANGKSVAVRVFHPPANATDRANQAVWRQRYLLLQKHLSSVRVPPEIVEVMWMDRGIRVNNQELPVTVMPWIEARSLDGWIQARMTEGRGPEYLGRFADNFRNMMRELRTAKIAHGDLHHGNVLIERGTGHMRLIDYDAMWTPTLAQAANDEIGHPNYQHPSYFYPRIRSRPYGPEIDNFSAFVIYLSAKAVQSDPTLWQRFHRGDDHLIFTHEDYLAPQTADVFRALQASPSQTVRKLGAALARYCAGPAEAIPHLERAIALATREGAAATPPNGSAPWFQGR